MTDDTEDLTLQPGDIEAGKIFTVPTPIHWLNDEIRRRLVFNGYMAVWREKPSRPRMLDKRLAHDGYMMQFRRQGLPEAVLGELEEGD